MDERGPMSGNDVVVATGLTRRFGRKKALDGVTLRVPRGRVFGLVGENGAGKTTFIKHALGLLKPTEGEIRIFGLDPIQDPVGVLSRTGYLSEDRDLPLWMRVRELVRYTQAFYPTWDESYADELIRTFGLDPETKVKALSRGQRAQAGLLIALAYRPELLLLDEPSSGLDPVVRRDILGAIIRTVADEGRTVVFSSHLLDEVERIADDVALIHQGKLVLCDSLDAIKARHRRVTVRFHDPQPLPPQLPGALAWEGGGIEWTVVFDGEIEAVRAVLGALGAEVIDDTAPTLEDIFVARVGVNRATVRED